MPRYVDEATMSPAKRSKQYSDVLRGRQGNTSAVTPLISSKSTKQSKSRSRKKCPECYCQTSKQQPVPKKHEIKSAGRVCIACSDGKVPHNSPANVDDSLSNVDSQRRTLEEARSLISYSPESVFLKGLKLRSQVHLDEPETSSPEVDQTRITGDRPRNIHAREQSRQSANNSSFGATTRTDNAKHSKLFSNKSSLGASNATEKPERSRPKVKSPSFGRSNVTGKAAPSFRRDVSEPASQNATLQHQPSKESTQPIANSSIPRRSTSASARKFVTNISSNKINAPSSRTGKPVGPSDRPKICRPVLAKLLPANATSYKPTISTTLANTRPCAINSTRHNPSPPKENSRPGVKSYKHRSISAAKDRFKTDTKTAKAKFRPASSRATSCRRNSRTSPTISTASSPNSSLAGGDFKGPTERRTHSSESTPCSVQTRENCQPTVKSPSIKSKKKKGKYFPRESDRTRDLPAKDIPSYCSAEDNSKPSSIVSSPCRKYKNIHKLYCKNHCRKKSFKMTTDAIKNNPFNECYHNIRSPTVPCCKSPHKECHRKSTRHNQSCVSKCCNNCYCGCRQLAGHEACSWLSDSKPAMQAPHCCDCGGPLQDDWVDEISRYRQSHWFDCHAYPTNRERPTSLGTKGECRHARHGGLHRHMLNDRLFPIPLPCTSSCEQCRGQPEDADIRQPQTFPREITLNSTRYHDKVQVVFPQATVSKPKADEPNTGPFKIYHDPEKKSRGCRKSTGCMLTHPIYSTSLRPKFPVPANSLALRYQKGIV